VVHWPFSFRITSKHKSFMLHGVSHRLHPPPSTTQDRAVFPPHGVLCFVLYILQDIVRQSVSAPGAGFKSLEFLSPGGLPLSWCLAILVIVRFVKFAPPPPIFSRYDCPYSPPHFFLSPIFCCMRHRRPFQLNAINFK